MLQHGGAICAFGLSFWLIPSIISLASEKQLFDMPSGHKQHKTPVPALGGIAIFAGFWVALMGFGGLETLMTFKFPFIAGLLLFLIGIRDDLVGMRATKKFIFQESKSFKADKSSFPHKF